MTGFLHHNRFLAVGVLMAAFLSRKVHESKPYNSLDLSFIVPESCRPTIDNNTWWVVAYALLAYTMFGSRRLLVQRSLARISSVTRKAIKQVASREALSNIRSSVSMRSMQLFGASHDDKLCGKRVLSLSVDDSFVNEAHVASMTLQDVSDVFQYVFQCESTDFDYDNFISQLQEPARCAIAKLEIALLQTRGERVNHQPCPKSSEFGSVDTLAFVGACRIFAEWMPIRQVPEGYARYAFGLGVAKRDMVGNISKVEKAVHTFLDNKVAKANGGSVYSPSIREMLVYEVATKKHPHRPKVGNNTAGQGLLWLKRQLQYQTSIFGNSLEIPFHFPDAKAAARAAYEQVYSPYHGFLVRQIFQSSFDAAPSFREILQHMNAPRGKSLERIASTFNFIDEDAEGDTWIQFPVEKESIRPIPILPRSEHSNNPFLDFIGNAIRENVIKIGQCMGLDARPHPSLNAMASVKESSAFLASENLDNAIITNDVSNFLFVMRPFLHSLDILIQELKMNDPSRV
jgi:hypothetical protein